MTNPDRPMADLLRESFGDGRQVLKLLADEQARTVEVRAETRKRVLHDPTAHAITELLRRVVLAVADDSRAETTERDRAILDGTAAILDLVDYAIERGRADAIADLRDDAAYWDWMASRPEHASDNVRHRAAEFLEAKGRQP